MKIKTQFRINILISICLAVVVAGILFYADREIDRETEKNFLADRISKGVFELFMVSNTYLTYHEERPREQWNVKLASLKKMIDDARLGARNQDENLEILSRRCDEMRALFRQITSYAERIDKPSQKEATLVREAYERLITNLTAKGQEMVNHAFLLIQESNRDLASVKTRAIASVIASTLLAIGISILISLLLSGRILTDLSLLQKGTGIVAGGNLDYRVDIQSDDEIGRLAHAFNEMTHRLKESENERESYIKKLAQSNRELEDFAFIASHDLQEPLRKIQTFGDRVKEKWGDDLGEGGRDYLARMQNAAMRMQTLISGLLSYSRVTTRPEPFSPIALTPLVQEVISDLAVPIEQTGARVDVAELPVIESSPQQMRQLFQNLLGNGLKFHREERPFIKVSGEKVKAPTGKETSPDSPWVEIRVEDNGIGFDEKYLDRIFQPFQRLHGRGSPYDGTGIGLAICRKIVERHGGTITAKSAPGKGATFIVTLPVRQRTVDPLSPSGASKKEEQEQGEERKI
jgi:signal transduction histidine kinase